MENIGKYSEGITADGINAPYGELYVIKNKQKHFVKRSFKMKYNFSKTLSRSVIVLLTITLITTLAMGQNLILNNNSVTNTGTINVKGNINTSGASSAITLGGTVDLNGTTTQDISVSGQNITFNNLLKSAGSTATMTANVTVNSSFTLSAGTFAVADKTLTFNGDPSNTGGIFDVSNASGNVYYSKSSGNQSTLAGNYAASLYLNGAATHNLAGDITAATFSHTGGALTVNNNLTVTGATPSFATIADISNGKTLALSGDGAKSIAAFTNPSGGTLSNSGIGLMTITALNGNAGTINTGAGGATFTNAATNAGNINGGAGPVTFSNTLAHSAGTITAGSGDITFTGTVTQTGGTITSASSGNVLNFAGDVDNSGGGTISLTGTGDAEFGGALTAGTLSFASGSTVTFDGGAQTIPNTTYGNLILDGSADKIAASSLTLAGNLTLNRNLDVYTNGGTLTFSSAGTVSGMGEVVGAVARTHTLVGGTEYAFNRSEVTMQFASNEDADVTLTMRPGVAPSGVGANYINRYYGVSSTANLNMNNATLKLYYLDGEKIGSITESKLGISKFDGSSLSKLSSNNGSYTRVDGALNNTIALSNVNQGLSGITQFAIVPLEYYTIASGNWNAIATWGYTPDDIPTATDDAEVRHTVAVTAPATIANLTITDDVTYTGVLNVSGANFNATTITNTGAINVDALRTLTLTGALTNNTGGASAITINGIANLTSVDNYGTFTIDGASAAANLSGAFTNRNGATLETANSGSVTVTGADLINSGTITNAGTITVE